jgi:hypothetical protein
LLCFTAASFQEEPSLVAGVKRAAAVELIASEPDLFSFCRKGGLGEAAIEPGVSVAQGDESAWSN